MKKSLSFVVLSVILGACVTSELPVEGIQNSYENILDLTYDDCRTDNTQCSLFSDNGAWHAYGLPELETSTGFEGPFLFTRNFGYWMRGRTGQFKLINLNNQIEYDTADAISKQWAIPGRVFQTFAWDDVIVGLTLIMADGRSSLIDIEIARTKPGLGEYEIMIWGDRGSDTARLIANSENAVLTQFSDSESLLTTEVISETVGVQAEVSDSTYVFKTLDPIAISEGQTTNLYLRQSAFINQADLDFYTGCTPRHQNFDQLFDQNNQRWHQYLERYFTRNEKLKEDPSLSRLAVKSVMTLVTNWRSPAGDLVHDGIYPSYAIGDFNGVWSWDTWKQAVATAYFDSTLAKNQIRGMFAYQNERGMVADVIYYDRSENNWRDTKPPLSAWAVWAVYQESSDVRFLVEMYPKLVAYHNWWYADRDHDQDGLAEFGSTDGTRIAAAWESGMDNAVRFDSSQMLQTNDQAWSVDQESVDLNSFLYFEKLQLAKIAAALGESDQAIQFEKDALRLQERVQAEMFDLSTGFFHDISIIGDKFISVQAAEGWGPLWTGLATSEQADAVAQTLLDEDKFNTHVPFPTLSAAHPEFNPVDGYWRGPVWLDQAYFGVAGLRNYGMEDEAEKMTWKLIQNAEGLTAQAPIYENYNPLTGEGIEAPHFSWSAAHYLMLLAEMEETNPADGDTVEP